VTERTKIIVSCYACSPGRGSEPGMGWHFVRALAGAFELWVLVEQHEFQEVLERYVAAHPEEMRHIHFIYVPCGRHPLLRKLWPPSYYWFYNLWHRRAFHVAQRLHREIGFDLAYKLNMVTFREPGYLWKLPIPFAWGPVGALGTTDWRLLPQLGFLGVLEFSARNLINAWQARTRRRSRLAARKAARCGGLLAATGENQRMMKSLWGVDSELMCEIGVDRLSAAAETLARGDGEPLKIVWSGLFERRKALPILLRALATLPVDRKWTLDVLGDGPEAERWRRLTARLGLSDRVRFHGWLPRSEAAELVKSAHLFALSSVHDLTSTVLLEALGCGVPVVCLDHCGFADVVDESCGIKVPVGSVKRVIAGFADAIEKMMDERHRRRCGAGAVLKAREYLWETKAARLNETVRRLHRPIDETAQV